METAPEDVVLNCQDGVRLAGQRYRNFDPFQEFQDSQTIPHTIRILAWHGWLDNCRSFGRLGPSLLEKFSAAPDTRRVDLVVLDFPGHGKSSHKSLDGVSTVLMDLVYYVHDAIHQLKWHNENDDGDYVPPVLIGHSMGGSISLLYAAAFPTSKLILLDSLGPHTKKANDVVKGFQKHVQQRLKGKPPCSIYPSLANAIATRSASAKAFPGNQYISKETATELVTWASSMLPDGKLQFHHDQRVKWASMLSLTDEQVYQLYQDVAASSTKTCLLLAKDGMPFPPAAIAKVKELLKPAICETLPGSHHFHADPETSQGVADQIAAFLLKS